MHDIVGRRLHRLRSLGQCPECFGDQFQPGPKGGAAQNFECELCRRRFNLTYARGELVFAQEIGRRPNPDDWAEYRAAYEVGPLPR